MRSRTNSGAGFSLIEVMIAVAVMGVVTAQLFVVFANQKKVFASNDRALDVQETTRLTLDLISFDTRMVGFMVPSYAAVSSVDGGTTAADRLCVSSPSTAGTGAGVANKMSRFDGAQATAIGAASVTVASTDFDGDGLVDFTPSAGVIVASPTKTYCARIDQVLGNVITFANPEDATAYVGGTAAGLTVVPANVYELDEDPTKLELRRNSLLLASQIEDFQVEYWLDSSGAKPNGIEDGDDEFPVNDLNNPDPPTAGIPANNAAIRRVRVSVTARTIREDAANSATGKLDYGRPALANRNAAAAPDMFRRRSFTASIVPRNLEATKE
jgi:prepilin-type N-terminal cleavage/methylation domain-containing protein